jgi:lysozyme family protein
MADIVAAITYVLKNEDRKLTGVVTSDSGGTTRFGVAQKFHPDLDPTFYTCPKDQALAIADQIYKDEYAAPLQLSLIISQPIANKLLDIGINCGVKVAAGMAQNGVCDLGQHVTIDREIGPASVAAINTVNSVALMNRLIVLSQNYYRSVAIKQHASANTLASWLTRAGKPGI